MRRSSVPPWVWQHLLITTRPYLPRDRYHFTLVSSPSSDRTGRSPREQLSPQCRECPRTPMLIFLSLFVFLPLCSEPFLVLDLPPGFWIALAFCFPRSA